MRTRRRAGAPFLLISVLTALGLVASLTACTDDDGAKPLTFDDDAIYTGTDFSAPDLSGTTIRGDIAYIQTTEFSGGTLAAVDLRTGQTLWSADDGDPILGGKGMRVDLRSPHDPAPPLLRDTADGAAEVLVPYRSVASVDDGEDKKVRLGVVGLDAKDGHANWVSDELISGTSPKFNLTMVARPVLANAEVVVAASAPGDNAPIGVTPGVTTLAIDPADGSILWSEKDRWPTALGGGSVVLADDVDDHPLVMLEGGPTLEENTTIAAVDQRTGAPKWDAAKVDTSTRVLGQVGEYAVVRAVASTASSITSEYATDVVRLGNGDIVDKSGAVVGSLKDGGGSAAGSGTADSDGKSSGKSDGPDSGGSGLDEYVDCASSEVMVACESDGRVTTLRVGGGDTAEGNDDADGKGAADGRSGLVWASSTPFKLKAATDIAGVFGETVVVEYTEKDTEHIAALDPEGRIRTKELGRAPAAMTDDYAIFCPDDANPKKVCEIDAAKGGAERKGNATSAKRGTGTSATAGPDGSAGTGTSAGAALAPLTIGEPLWSYTDDGFVPGTAGGTDGAGSGGDDSGSDAGSVPGNEATGGDSGKDVGLVDATGVTLAPDAVVYSGENDYNYTDATVVAEADTGAVRWSVAAKARLGQESGSTVTAEPASYGDPVVLDHSGDGEDAGQGSDAQGSDVQDSADRGTSSEGKGWSLLVPAASAGRTGVASLAGKSGKLEWFHAVGDSTDRVRVAAAAGTHILAEVYPTTRDDESISGVEPKSSGATTHTVSISLAAGSAPKPTTSWDLAAVEPIAISGESALVRRLSGSGDDAKERGVALIRLDDEKTVVWDSGTDAGSGGGSGSAPGTGADSGAAAGVDHSKEVPTSALAAGGLLFVNWADGAEYRDGATGQLLGTIGKELSDCTAAESAKAVLCSTAIGRNSMRVASPIVFDTSGADTKGTGTSAAAIAPGTGTSAAAPTSGTATSAEEGTGGASVSVVVRQPRNLLSNEILGGTADRFVVDAPDRQSQVTIDAWGRTVDKAVPGLLETVNEEGIGLFRTCRPRICAWNSTWEVRRVDN